MVSIIRASLLWAGVLGAAAQPGGSDSSPRFEDYSVPVEVVRRAVPVRIVDPSSRRFRTKLREASRHAPDFAGHYILARWGCGAPCVMAAAIDAKTGVVTNLPFTVSSWPLDVTEPLEHKLNSRLIIVRGSRNEKGSGTYFYEFVDHRFKLLRQIGATR